MTVRGAVGPKGIGMYDLSLQMRSITLPGGPELQTFPVIKSQAEKDADKRVGDAYIRCLASRIIVEFEAWQLRIHLPRRPIRRALDKLCWSGAAPPSRRRCG